MPRAKWEKLSDDPEKHLAHVEKMLRQSSSKKVESVLEGSLPRRALHFRSMTWREEVDLQSILFTLAVAIQTRGELAEAPCYSCESDKRAPFPKCIRLPSEQLGRCANCIYLRGFCSHGDQARQLSQKANHGPATVHPEEKSINVPTKQLKRKREDKDPKEEIEDSAIRGILRTSSEIDKHSLDQYLVLGNLTLPRPPPELKERAEQLERDLKDLDNRIMDELPNRPITDLNVSFKNFRAQEQAIWKSTLQKDVSPALLVRPSGSLDSLLANRLNQPSFTTDHTENGETADHSNGCMAMVMGNGFKPSNTLLFDHIHRREATSEAIEEYHEKVLECHENFTNSIADSMKAKVEIIWGRKVQQRLIQTNDFEVLPLWGDFEGVILMLAYERNYGNADPRFRFRRVVLLASHPQNMFYQRKNSELSIRQDKVMMAAARMVRNCVPWVQDYYSEKKWYSCVPARFKTDELRLLARGLEMKQQAPPSTILSGDEDTSSQSELTFPWDIFFSKYPHSNNTLRKLIPPALDALKNCDHSDSWQLPPDLPGPVLEWFEGQKHILFSNVSISSFSDVSHELSRILPGTESNKPKLLLDLFKVILIHQQKSLQHVKGTHQDLWHSKFDGREIILECKHCKFPPRPDIHSRWAVSRPGWYILRRLRCQGPECRGQNRHVHPADTNLSYTWTSPMALNPSSQPIKHFDVGIYLRQQSMDIDDVPTAIKCWCIRCKEQTEWLDGSSTYTDTQPRWTNSTPSFYIARDKACERCRRDLRHGLGGPMKIRFIPIDSAIPSISQHVLKNFHKTYDAFGLETRRLLLGKLLPSSRDWNKTAGDM